MLLYAIMKLCFSYYGTHLGWVCSRTGYWEVIWA